MLEGLKKDWAYKDFHFRDIRKPEYKHLFLLLFWPVYLFIFFLTERVTITGGYTMVHCALDDKIPFCEYFIIPYAIWYPFWIFMVLYTVGFEVPVFKRLMRYFMVTLTISLIIYIIWPTGQDMWPKQFPRDNFCVWLTKLIYSLDRPTDVCPSEHVSTAFGVVFAAAASKRFSGKVALTLCWLEAILVAVGVAFVKQHSVIDVVAAIPVILIGYFTSFHKWKRDDDTGDVDAAKTLKKTEAVLKQESEQEQEIIEQKNEQGHRS